MAASLVSVRKRKRKVNDGNLFLSKSITNKCLLTQNIYTHTPLFLTQRGHSQHMGAAGKPVTCPCPGAQGALRAMAVAASCPCSLHHTEPVTLSCLAGFLYRPLFAAPCVSLANSEARWSCVGAAL